MVMSRQQVKSNSMATKVRRFGVNEQDLLGGVYASNTPPSGGFSTPRNETKSRLVSDVSRQAKNAPVHTSETKRDFERKEREKERLSVAERAAQIQQKSEARKARKRAVRGKKQSQEPEEKEAVADLQAIPKRAKRKYKQKGILVALMELKSPREKGYRNAYYCNHCMTVENGKASAGRLVAIMSEDARKVKKWERDHPGEFYPFKVMRDGAFCKKRWCRICSSVQANQFIKKYLPVFQTFQKNRGAVMVTLTGPTVTGSELEQRVELMIKCFARIVDSEKRLYLKEPDKYNRLEGWRKTEITERPDDLYHPHFHIIIHGNISDGYRVVALWERAMAKEGVKIEANLAQDVTICDEDSMVELTKYISKDVTKGHSAGSQEAAKRLDVIYAALEGKQVYSSFGFKLPKPTVEEMTETAMENDANTTKSNDGEYHYSRHSWQRPDTGERLGEWGCDETPKVAEKHRAIEERAMEITGKRWTVTQEENPPEGGVLEAYTPPNNLPF
jgi:hypothetical protein